MTQAQIGSISHGTMRTQDLLSAFADELERLMQKGAPDAPTSSDWRESFTTLIADARHHVRLIEEQRSGERENEEAHFVLEDLFDALWAYAPPSCYFGAHEGDGSDYGFWPKGEL